MAERQNGEDHLAAKGREMRAVADEVLQLRRDQLSRGGEHQDGMTFVQQGTQVTLCQRDDGFACVDLRRAPYLGAAARSKSDRVKSSGRDLDELAHLMVSHSKADWRPVPQLIRQGAIFKGFGKLQDREGLHAMCAIDRVGCRRIDQRDVIGVLLPLRPAGHIIIDVAHPLKQVADCEGLLEQVRFGGGKAVKFAELGHGRPPMNVRGMGRGARSGCGLLLLDLVKKTLQLWQKRRAIDLTRDVDQADIAFRWHNTFRKPAPQTRMR